MSECIDRQALLDAIPSTEEDKQISLYGAVSDFISLVHDVPAVDVAPVVHGEWHYNENGRDFGLGAWACSCCDTCNHNIPGNPNINPYIWSGSKFCPNCGAKMDGGGET